MSTNIYARGIDQAALNMVINFDLPKQISRQDLSDCATYLHRVGRVGRFGKKGTAITICNKVKHDLNFIAQIEEYFNMKLVETDVPRFIKESKMVLHENVLSNF